MARKLKNKRNNKQCRNSIHYHTDIQKKTKTNEDEEEKADLREANKASANPNQYLQCVGVNQGLKEPERMNCEQMHIFDKQQEEEKAGDD